MKRPPERARAAGFTLIEILLAMAILGFLMTIMFGAFNQTAQNKRQLEAAQERVHTARVALMRMSRELEMAYLATETSPGTYLRTFMTATSQATVDELSFSMFAHQRLRGGLAESDTSVVTYYADRDPDDPKITNLMRRETRRLQADDPKVLTGESYILCPDVSRVKFSFYDFKKKEWENEWNTHTPGAEFLPSHVRISLTVYDELGREVTYSTDARIRMTERLGT
jgi:prepilin-type N-terminal cleavage/methylation domain-containing protein